MAYETIIVAYESFEAANDAITCIRQMGIPSYNIRRYPVDPKAIDEVAPLSYMSESSPSFWAWLFKRNINDEQLDVYKRALRAGGTIVSVDVMEEEADKVQTALSEFGPIEITEYK